MARENVTSTINIRYGDGVFTNADVGTGTVVAVAQGVASQTGGARPSGIKVPAGTSAMGAILGTLQSLESPSSDADRAPSGIRIASVATSGTLLVKKSTAPEAADVGKYIAIDQTASRDAGTVTTDADASLGLVVDITGTTTSDYLIVLFR